MGNGKVSVKDLLGVDGIKVVKDACSLIRSAEISIQAVIIDGVSYAPPLTPLTREIFNGGGKPIQKEVKRMLNKIKRTKYSVERDGRCAIMQSSDGAVRLCTPFGTFHLVKSEIEGFGHVGLKTLNATVYPPKVIEYLFSRPKFNKKDYDAYYERSPSSRFCDKFNAIMNDRKMTKTTFIVGTPAWSGLSDKSRDWFTVTIERKDKLNGR